MKIRPLPFLIKILFLLLIFGNSNFLQAQKKEKASLKKIKALRKNEPVDILLNRIDAAHLMLNQFDDKANTNFSFNEIKNALPRIKDGLNLVTSVINQKNKRIDVINLQMYAVLLNDIEIQLKTWKDDLMDSHKELTNMNADLKAFTLTRDSVFTKMTIDSNYRTLINSELNDLGIKYGENQGAINESLERTVKLETYLSGLYYKTIELEDGIYDLNKTYWLRVSQKEAPFIWERKKKDTLQNNPDSSIIISKNISSSSITGQKIILSNYFAHNRIGYLALGVFGLFFFIWVSLNYRKTSLIGSDLKNGVLKIDYLSPIPLASSFILVLSITPFLDLDTPTLFFEILQTLLSLFLTYLFYKTWPKKYFYYWLVFLAIYIAFVLLGQTHGFTIFNIILSLALNLTSILMGVFFLRRVYKDDFFSGFEKAVITVFIFCNALAFFLNLFSHLSLAHQIGYAGIFGLIQVISLTTGFKILSEGLFLQAMSIRAQETEGFIFEDQKIQKNLNLVFLILIILFWSISYTNNLNIFSPIYEGVESFLGVPRQIGNTTFAYGNVILFFLIITIANFLQKFLGFFFGENYSVDNQQFKKKGSRLAITRLLLLLSGFLIAIMASGLPVDRITILIGALGVGIGLGLQSIVNNLVSGIILIFERPFRIGDLIEVGTRKGRVKEIGLRSSKLLTSEGSEVIIPNGDLLSERVVNWTLSNDFARIEFMFKIANDSDVETAKELIRNEFKQNSLVLPTLTPEILVQELTDTTINLKASVWISNVNQSEEFKSEFLGNIYSQFKTHSILIKP